MKEQNSMTDINSLINSAWGNEIKAKFEEKVLELEITKRLAVDNMGIASRTLDGILNGSIKQVDFVSLFKLAQFLEISYEEIINLYIKEISKNNEDDLEESKKRSFIINNFDLSVLKTIGVIESIKDFEHIENRLKFLFEVNSIYEIDFDDNGSAFSSVKIMPKSKNPRRYFIANAKPIFKNLKNPNKYNRDLLVQYFPKIRLQSLDTENGLLNVIKVLYELGVTVIFRPKIPKAKIRGGTFSVNNKPCIVITNNTPYYPTLWFSLIHELFHVIFDWEEIQSKSYHISDDEYNALIEKQKEDEADEFAVNYFIHKEYKEELFNKIDERLFIREFAINSQIHPSIIYAIYGYQNDNGGVIWKNFENYFPPIKPIISKLGNHFGYEKRPSEVSNFYNENIFNF